MLVAATATFGGNPWPVDAPVLPAEEPQALEEVVEESLLADA